MLFKEQVKQNSLLVKTTCCLLPSTSFLSCRRGFFCDFKSLTQLLKRILTFEVFERLLLELKCLEEEDLNQPSGNSIYE